MSSRSHAVHPLLRSRATVALIGLLALVFTGLSVSQAHAAAPAGSYTGTSDAYNGATVSFNADAPVYDPQVVVSPKTITESEVADTGISVTATGFPANEEIGLTVVENEAGGIVVTDADGSVTVTGWMIGDPSPGERTLSARVGEVFATDTFMVTADAPVYDPQISVSPESMTVSEAEENGVDVTITGFPPSTNVDVTSVRDEFGGPFQTDGDGNAFIDSWPVGQGGVGEYEIIASYEELQASATLTITEDDDDPVYDPQVTVDPDTVTLDELADSGVTVTGAGFPESDFITLTVGGFVIEGTTTDASGGVVLDYTSTDLSVGDHVVQLAHNDIIATTTLTVEENEPVYDPQADASPSTLTESELIDPGVTIIGTDFPADETVTLTVAGDPAGTETADANGDVEFTFRSDSLGTGSHDAVLTSGDLSASTTFTVTEDAPVYNPQAAVNPTTLTESELAESGVTVTGSDFPANEVVNLTVDGVAAGSQTADADGTVAIGYITDTLAPGTYSAQLTNGDLTAGASFTVEADPAPVYDPEISLSTPEVTVSVLADEGVEVAGTGFPENATVTLFFDGTEVVSGDTDADGAVVFTLWAENYPLGQYTLSLEADAEGAQVATTLTLIADEEGEDPAPVTIPAAEPNPADLTPALQGAVEIPAAAAPGDRIVLTVTGVDPGTEVGVWIFSEATYLGTHTVDGNGQVTVILPADLPEGTHTISVWTNEGLVGWDTIAVSSDGDAGPTDPEDGTAESGDQLAVTGGTLAVGTLAGGALLLAIGFGLVLLARTRAKVIA